VIRRVILALLIVAPGPALAQAPNKAQWLSELTTWGTTWCNQYPGYNIDQKVGSSQYDRERVWFQLYDYTGDTFWNTCAQIAEAAFRDSYVIRGNGAIPEQFNYTDGLRMDYERTGDVTSRNAVNLMRQNAPYCTVSFINATNAGQRSLAIRILVNCLEAHWNADLLGFTPTAAQATAKAAHKEALYGAIEDLVINRTAVCTQSGCTGDGVPLGKHYIQPFVHAGLACAGMIRDFEATGDARAVPYCKAALDMAWDLSWRGANPATKSFSYVTHADDAAFTINVGQGNPSPDLNQFFSWPLMWIYQQTGDTTYRDRADVVFSGGVTQSQGEQGAKQYNQIGRESFKYVIAREAAAAAPVIGVSGALPGGTVGVPYSYTIPVNWGTTPSACDETAGNLPAGSPAFTSTAIPAGCQITGTPTGAETATFTEKATATGGLTDSEAGLSITIIATAPTITTPTLSNGEIGTASETIVCEGGTPGYTFSVLSGALCPHKH
jgi:hypothetical protein